MGENGPTPGACKSGTKSQPECKLELEIQDSAACVWSTLFLNQPNVTRTLGTVLVNGQKFVRDHACGVIPNGFRGAMRLLDTIPPAEAASALRQEFDNLLDASSEIKGVGRLVVNAKSSIRWPK